MRKSILFIYSSCLFTISRKKREITCNDGFFHFIAANIEENYFALKNISSLLSEKGLDDQICAAVQKLYNLGEENEMADLMYRRNWTSF